MNFFKREKGKIKVSNEQKNARVLFLKERIKFLKKQTKEMQNELKKLEEENV